MPGEPYTGHAENEYIKRKDLMASLEMYAAMIERLATSEVTTAMPENAPTHAPTAASPADRADVANPRRVEQPWMSLADWRLLHETQLNSPERKSARLVFLGDSIANGWVGSEAFRNRFAPLSPMSLGIGGDQTQHLLWRIEDGALAGLEPRLTVLLIGVNNLGNGFSPEETAAGIRAVVRAARQRLPKTPILLLSILPAGATPSDSLREKILATNPFLAGLAEPGSVTLVDLATVPLEADGTISPETMADFLHPTAKGYERLTDALAPFVERLVAP